MEFSTFTIVEQNHLFHCVLNYGFPEDFGESIVQNDFPFAEAMRWRVGRVLS